MIRSLFSNILQSRNQREARGVAPIIRRVNELEAGMGAETLESLRSQTAAWQAELRDIANPAKIAKTLDRILPHAFAVVKHAARLLAGTPHTVCGRPEVWNFVHYDSQLHAGLAMHRGSVAEMATGEGKSLAASLPVYLNALVGRGVHLVTVNEYLARRDADAIGFLLRALGLSVGCILQDQSPADRRAQYACDVTYGTSAEFGFDYLRDNGIAVRMEQRVQRGHWYAVIDEADSVLIDEARTPLIITMPGGEALNQYTELSGAIKSLLRAQTELTNRIAEQASRQASTDDSGKLGESLLLLKLGAPAHRVLLRLLENPHCLSTLRRAETRYKSGILKSKLAALKEQLFYTVEVETRSADLTEKGRRLARPDDLTGANLPDLIHAYVSGKTPEDERSAAEHSASLLEAMERENVRFHNILQLLRAHALHERNVHYVVEDGEVIIVDENTGRKMPGRRWSDGLHQAVEAKEGLRIENENRTVATITIQNYFRLYAKLAGMTGTAETEAAELHDIYGLDVSVIPPHRPRLRIDRKSVVFPTRLQKLQAAVNIIRERHGRGQPVLVGTASVEASETLARLLRRERIPHTVLNAANHASEAELIAAAGERGAVTVSTNMAGRGTDIKLGEGVTELGGLLVLGTERHESRRIDRQLRGRCGRQGDPGESMFLISLEDSLMNLTRHEISVRAGDSGPAGQVRQPSAVGKVDSAQRQLEQAHYTQRKRTLEFDKVLNSQRNIIYGLRGDAMDPATREEVLSEFIEEAVGDFARRRLEGDEDGHGATALLDWADQSFFPAAAWQASGVDPRNGSKVIRRVVSLAVDSVGKYAGASVESSGATTLEALAFAMIASIDRHWIEHLRDVDSLRDGIHLQSMAQKDPLVEFGARSFDLFEGLVGSVRREALEAFVFLLGKSNIPSAEVAAA